MRETEQCDIFERESLFIRFLKAFSLLFLVKLTCKRPPTLEMVGEEPNLGGRAERCGI